MKRIGNSIVVGRPNGGHFVENGRIMADDARLSENRQVIGPKLGIGGSQRFDEAFGLESNRS